MLDLRWQLVLDCLGREPLFSQGGLVDFRKRLNAANMDRHLLERTVELARNSGDDCDVESRARGWARTGARAQGMNQIGEDQARSRMRT